VANTGFKGVCETTAGGDDNQVIAVGWGKPHTACIAVGLDGTLQSSIPAGVDDALIFDGANVIGIETGPNGINDSTFAAGDVPLIPFQRGQQFEPCINTGANGRANTTANNASATGDDVQVLGPGFVSLSPNETDRCDICVNQINNFSDNQAGFLKGVRLTFAHECGHGTHIEHYTFTDPPPANHPKATIMADDPVGLNPLPKKYDDADTVQMRLHSK
jgi:hypothetical protein